MSLLLEMWIHICSRAYSTRLSWSRAPSNFTDLALRPSTSTVTENPPCWLTQTTISVPCSLFSVGQSRLYRRQESGNGRGEFPSLARHLRQSLTASGIMMGFDMDTMLFGRLAPVPQQELVSIAYQVLAQK